MLYDLEDKPTKKTLKFAPADGSFVEISYDDLNRHSAAWLARVLLQRDDGEVLE